jgi:hypothetical protein
MSERKKSGWMHHFQSCGHIRLHIHSPAKRDNTCASTMFGQDICSQEVVCVCEGLTRREVASDVLGRQVAKWLALPVKPLCACARVCVCVCVCARARVSSSQARPEISALCRASKAKGRSNSSTAITATHAVVSAQQHTCLYRVQQREQNSQVHSSLRGTSIPVLELVNRRTEPESVTHDGSVGGEPKGRRGALTAQQKKHWTTDCRFILHTITQEIAIGAVR